MRIQPAVTHGPTMMLVLLMNQWTDKRWAGDGTGRSQSVDPLFWTRLDSRLSVCHTCTRIN